MAKYLSFPTPVGENCGKVAFSDFHSGGTNLGSVSSIPGGCSRASLTDEQRALEFLFFDLSGCVSPDMTAPPPPPPSGP